MSACLTSILNLPPWVCHTITMIPRPPANTLECMCVLSQRHRQIFRFGFVFLCQPCWAGGVIVVRQRVWGFQCSSLPTCSFQISLQRLSVLWWPQVGRDGNFCADWVAVCTYVAVRVSRSWFTREDGVHGLPQVEISSLQVSCRGHQRLRCLHPELLR